jgi:hypothetical protein
VYPGCYSSVFDIDARRSEVEYLDTANLLLGAEPEKAAAGSYK